MNHTFRQAIEDIKAKRFQNVWKQAVETDDKLDLETIEAKAQANPLIQRVMKEAVLADAIDVLGAVYMQVIDAADKLAVARDIIWMLPVTQPSTRFYKRKKGAVWRIAQGPPPFSEGRFEPETISLAYEYGQDALFGQSYLEDCPFGVIEKELAEVGQLLEEQLTTDVIALYDAVADANLASGDMIDTATSGTFAWADLVALWTAFKQGGYSKKPGRKVILLSEWEVQDLFNDDKFLNALYPASSKLDIDRGVVGSVFGATIVESDMMPDDAGGSNGNYAYFMNVDQAAVCTMRRDKLVQPYEEKLNSGVIATNRYGLGTLTTQAIARADIVHA